MKILKKLLEELGIEDIESKLEKLEKYKEGILEWNNKVNITTITNEMDFEIKHYVDSLLCADSPEIINANTIIDVGTGGGFPGIPLAIIFPRKNFVLMDSLKKRLRIIDELIEEIEIVNVTTVHGRAEELSRKKEYRDAFDVCVSRAVANLSTLSEYCLPFVKQGGTFIAYKGPDSAKEIKAATNAIKSLGGSLNRVSKSEIGIKLDGYDLEHELIYIEKIKKTLKKYPRSGGRPLKEPL